MIKCICSELGSAVAGQCLEIVSSGFLIFIEPCTFLPARFSNSSSAMEEGSKSTCRRVSCAVASYDHPHLPKGQICGINVTEHAVLALFLDEVLQLHDIRIPGWFDPE
jgi:hypothetical protein